MQSEQDSEIAGPGEPEVISACGKRPSILWCLLRLTAVIGLAFALFGLWKVLWWIELFNGAIDGSAGRVTLALAAGADPNARDFQRMRILHLAALQGNDAIVRELLKRGADVNGVSWHGETALLAAASRGRTSTVALLLEHSADPQTVYLWEGQELTPEIVRLLVRAGWRHGGTRGSKP